MKMKNSPPIKKDININTDKNKDNNDNNKIENCPSRNVLITNSDNNLKLNIKSTSTNNILSNAEKARIKYILKYNDKELNGLEYKQAVKFDHRTYFGYFFSLLKTKHLIFKVVNKNDYNSRMIKIYLCFFNFGLCYTVNALFFSDETMHQIYEDGGDFNFIYQLPQIIYSTIISFVFGFFIDMLALSEDNILELKHEKITGEVAKKAKILLQTLFFKFINFFVFSFLFLIIFWYYMSCFCAVYKNTQFHLIKDTLISFGTSMISPLGISLIPGIFRIPALRKRKSWLYTFSKILQLL